MPAPFHCVLLGMTTLFVVTDVGCNGKTGEAENAFKSAMEAVRKGDYDKAIADLHRGHPARSEIRRGVPQPWCGLRGGKGDYDKAIADYTEAIRLDPKAAEAYYNRGMAYARTRATTTRRSPTFTEAIRLDPDDAEAY